MMLSEGMVRVLLKNIAVRSGTSDACIEVNCGRDGNILLKPHCKAICIR